MNTAVGTLLLIRYGNGTQVARVTAVSPRGALKVERFKAPWGGAPGHWAASSLKANDDRIIGELPANDPRRAMPGFTVTP